ncbi:Endo-1,4-beta-xylanase 5-like protein [Drosera capensis]
MAMASQSLFMLAVGFCLCYAANAYDGSVYESYASIECKAYPEVALYNGGILRDHARNIQLARGRDSGDTYGPGFLLHDLFRGFYTFSTWIMITDADPSLIRASLTVEGTTYDCIGTVVARQGCWSFLKGGFVLESPSNLSLIYFQNGDARDLQISLASPSLQGFTQEQWRLNQHYHINRERKRVVTIHTSDLNGERLQGAVLSIQQMSREFPFGSAIASTIIDNQPYQDWFRERFNAAVFENELKWYATEPEQGNVSYRVANQMLEFVRANQIVARGHNIFWEDPKYTPSWVLNLTSTELQDAVASRIQSLMSRYRGEFVHWDVSNEMLHSDFYEQRLGSSATLSLFEAAHDADPLATLFLNEFNVVETCADPDSTVDSYISRLLELKQGGISMDGIGLEGHFSVPNPPLMRAILDKLGTLGLPIWLTEVDISNQLDNQAQAVYLEEVLREGFSHPAVKGIMLWSAFHPQPRGCYQMCLTNDDFQNLPAGDVVDRLLLEWQTGTLQGVSDELGLFAFSGFLGEYRIMVRYGNRSAEATLSLSQGEETKHFNIQL